MRQRKFPEDVSGEVWGDDGPVRRTRAQVLAGNTQLVETTFRWCKNSVGQGGINLEDRVAVKFLG